jgi:glucoamylase
MQHVVTDGSTFVDLERDATNHAISMPTEKALEYTGLLPILWTGS